jgi:hypothetical protein
MATSVGIFLDAATLSLSTGIYTDASLLTPAADGWYSDGIKVRHQVGGVLVDNVVCPACLSEYESSSASVPFVSSPASLVDACLTLSLAVTYYYTYTSGPVGVLQSGDSVFTDAAGTTPLADGCYICASATIGDTNAYRVVGGVVTTILYNCSGY